MGGAARFAAMPDYANIGNNTPPKEPEVALPYVDCGPPPMAKVLPQVKPPPS